MTFAIGCSRGATLLGEDYGANPTYATRHQAEGGTHPCIYGCGATMSNEHAGGGTHYEWHRSRGDKPTPLGGEKPPVGDPRRNSGLDSDVERYR